MTRSVKWNRFLLVLVSSNRSESLFNGVYNHSGKLIYRQSCCLQVTLLWKELPPTPHEATRCLLVRDQLKFPLRCSWHTLSRISPLFKPFYSFSVLISTAKTCQFLSEAQCTWKSASDLVSFNPENRLCFSKPFII